MEEKMKVKLDNKNRVHMFGQDGLEISNCQWNEFLIMWKEDLTQEKIDQLKKDGEIEL